MSNVKPQALVLYESGNSALKTAADKVAAALKGQYAVVTKAAGSASIPEVLASCLIALGADSCAEAEWAELARALKGMNLAGRRAALFSANAAKAETFFKAMLRDTDIAYVGETADAAELTPAWLDAVRRA